MGKVYQSVRGVVQGTLHRRKPEPVVSAQANGNDTGLINDAMEELEKIFADGIVRLRAAVSEDQAVIANETQVAQQVMEGLKETIAGLEAKLRETVNTLQSKDLANQKMEETLNTEIRDLQSLVKNKDEALENRDFEVNDLKSKRDLLTQQVTQLESAIQQAKGEAASQSHRAEQAIGGLKETIAGLEAKLRETDDTLQSKETARQKMEETLNTEIRDLQSLVKKKNEALENRDSEITDLSFQRDLLTQQVTQMESAIQQAKGEAASQSQYAEQAIEGLKTTIAGLETKLKENEETLHSRDLASQNLEETLKTEIRDLQSLVKKKDEALESQGSEVNDLKSKRDFLAEQATQLESAIQQAKGEAAGQSQYAEQAIEGLKTTIAGLEARLKEAEDTLQSKETAGQKMEETLNTEVRELQSLLKKKDEALEDRDSEVNDLKSKRDVLAIQVTQLEMAIQQAKGEAASQSQHAEQAIEALKAKIAALEAQRRQPEQIVGGTDWTPKGLDHERDRQVIDINAEFELQTNRMKKAAAVTSVATQPARKTVSQAVFNRMIAEFSELTNVIGSIAALIVRDHVKALGESMEEFPQRRLPELIESLSGQIADDKLKAKFRERFTQM